LNSKFVLDLKLFFNGFFTDFFYNYYLLKSDGLYLKEIIEYETNLYEPSVDFKSGEEQYFLKKGSVFISFYNKFLKKLELTNLEKSNDNIF
jgi:hypothetical protein